MSSDRDDDQHQVDIGDDINEHELFNCPVCKGRRTVQPDRNTPPEPCPRCVDEDAEAEQFADDDPLLRQELGLEPDDDALVGALLAQVSYLVGDLAKVETVAILADADRDDLTRTIATLDTMSTLLAAIRDDVAQALARLMESDSEAIAGSLVTRTRQVRTDWDKEGVFRAVRGSVLDRWVTSRTTDPTKMREQFDLIDRTFADIATAFSFTPLVKGLQALQIQPNEFRATTRAERWSVRVKP